MSTCAVCQLSDGLVINLIVAEPTDLCPVEGCQLVLVPDGLPVDFDDKWDGTNFIEPDGTVVVIPPVVEEVIPVVEEVIPTVEPIIQEVTPVADQTGIV